MLPLLITALLAIYILGPGLVSRWLLSFIVPRRAVVQSKSEEWAGAILWCLLPLWMAWILARSFGTLRSIGGSREIQTVFSGLYSDAFFTAHRTEFFTAFRSFFWMNWALLWRLYLIVALVSAGMILMIKFYGSIRQKLENHEVLRSLLAIVVLPRVSDWHVLLSRMLLPSRDWRLFVDILTKNDNLYQGRLADKTLGPDGTLVNVTLAEPLKFRRARYLKALETQPDISPLPFWSKIPGEMFVVMASEITTMNVRYVQSKITNETAPEVIAALQALITKLEGIKN